MGDQLVHVRIPGPISESEILALDDEFQVLFADGIPGEYDGYDRSVDGSDGSLFFHGPDAWELFIQIFPELSVRRSTNRSQITLRFGPPEDGVEQRTFLISDIKVEGGD